ncbi:hypothetical protein GGS20DRAFT_567629 [Poronia punctata]|nr:hypothetical protein GGS20DRAFT_567629 [Poronia punctata]
MSSVDYQTAIYAVSWVLGSIVIVTCSVRIWGRVYLLETTGWDDLLMSLAAASAITCSALVTVSVYFGVGKHIEDITDPVHRSMAVKYTLIAPVFSIVASSFAKISVVVFLFRLLGMVAQRRHHAIAWILCAVLVALNIFAIAIILFFCVPPEAQWNPKVKGRCISDQFLIIVGNTQSAYNALMDLLVAIAPVFVISKLNINRRMKISLCGLMGGAAFGSIATILKITNLAHSDHSDLTWAWAPVTLWYTAEMDLIIIFGTIPTLWPLIRRFVGKNKDSQYESDPYRNAHQSPDHPSGTEAYQLSSNKSVAGEFTRALREVDDM